MEEDNGFLKQVCYKEKSGYTIYKCLNSEEFYFHDPDYYLAKHFQGNVCPGDPYSYQACDNRLNSKITNNNLLCGNYLCYKGYTFIDTTQELFNRCKVTCHNTDLNKVGCLERNITLPSGEVVSPGEVCNGECEVSRCEDEGECGGVRYGVYCRARYDREVWYVPPWFICDRVRFCLEGEDEKGCEVKESEVKEGEVRVDTQTYCRHARWGILVPVFNYTRCTPIKRENYFVTYQPMVYCQFDDVVQYQTNCSDVSRVGVRCKINGYLSTVSKYLICFDDNISACDDSIDSSCLTTKSCRIHKHLMCDGEVDCDDRADETHTVCSSTTKRTCTRRVGERGDLPIPLSWIRDGLWDCENGIDETGDWPTCGRGKTSRYVSSSDSKCENVFLCRTGTPGYIELGDLCDGLDTCGNENEICSVSSRSHSIKTFVSTTNRGLTKTLSYCQKGLRNMEYLAEVDCVEVKFSFPDADTFGVDTKTTVVLPNNLQSCGNMYGEQYLYTSCTGRCINASCPLRNIPRYEVCPEQFPNRVGTIVNNEYLIFFTRSHGNVYTNRYFVCDSKLKCIDYSRVCDLVYDCEDGSDELECANNFRCNSSGKLLPKTRKCDGNIDCADLSDECNNQCSKKLLEGSVLKGLSWLIGLLALVANIVIVIKGVRTLKRCRTPVALINRFFIVIIAQGDFFVGCYLFIIAVYDALIFKSEYCTMQISWITSFECSAIGVLSTVGSQISLFSMAGLSIVRMYGIRNSMRIPGKVTSVKALKIVGITLLIILASTLIAILPVYGSFEDFFVNGVRFMNELKIFTGTPDKKTVSVVIEAYYGRARGGTLRWKTLIQMMRSMFSRDLDYIDFTEKVDKVDFYGNDGVCLFKYFVQDEDPQRMFVWSLLTLDFLCFIVISVSYLFIRKLSRQPSKNLTGSKTNRQITQRNKRMNQRIAMIIATDFLCWVPFIVICALHSLELIYATPWYSIFSMAILPLNSIINPFLYDDVLTSAIRTPLRALTTRVRVPNSRTQDSRL